MAYTLNDKGNLLSRSDLLAGHKEDFTYDAMNRLTAWDVSKSNVSQVNIKFIKQMGRYGKISSKNRNGA
jgi:YD repeat-containing protein